jgi:hypothetical protein
MGAATAPAGDRLVFGDPHGGGRATTCPRSTPTSGRPRVGAAATTRAGLVTADLAGSLTSSHVGPKCPGCPPSLHPLRPRNDRGAGLTNGESDDGGFEEFCEFCPS